MAMHSVTFGMLDMFARIGITYIVVSWSSISIASARIMIADSSVHDIQIFSNQNYNFSATFLVIHLL